MERYFRIVDRISDWTGKIASLIVVALTLSICYDVIMLYLFAHPTFWTYDMTMMMYGSFAALGFAYCHYHKGHVRMDLLYGRASKRGKAVLEVIGYLLLFFPLMIVLTYKSGEHAYWAVMHGERASGSAWRPPLGPFKIVITYGFAVFLLQGTVDFLRSLIIAVRGAGNES